METTFRERYISFTGRVNRLAYFGRNIVLAILMVLTGIVAALLIPIGGLLVIPFVILAIIVFIVFTVGSISLTVRRLHDMNLSGLWYFGILGLGMLTGYCETAFGEFSLIVIVLSLISLFINLSILFWPGTKGPNRFGPDPLGRESTYIDDVFGDSSESRYYNDRYENEEDYAYSQKAGNKVESYNSVPTGSRGTKLSYTRKPER